MTKGRISRGAGPTSPSWAQRASGFVRRRRLCRALYPLKLELLLAPASSDALNRYADSALGLLALRVDAVLTVTPVDPTEALKDRVLFSVLKEANEYPGRDRC